MPYLPYWRRLPCVIPGRCGRGMKWRAAAAGLAHLPALDVGGRRSSLPHAPQVAWGRHETVGEYMAAALVWLENQGRVDVGEVAARFRAPRLTDLQVDPAALAGRR